MKKLLKIVGYFLNNVIGIKQVIDLLSQVIDSAKDLLDAIKKLKPEKDE